MIVTYSDYFSSSLNETGCKTAASTKHNHQQFTQHF